MKNVLHENMINKPHNLNKILSTNKRSLVININEDFFILENAKLIFYNFNFDDVSDFNFIENTFFIQTIKKENAKSLVDTLRINSIIPMEIPDNMNTSVLSKVSKIEEVEFNNCVLNSITLGKSSNIKKLIIKDSIIVERLTIEDKKLDELDLTNSIFQNKVKIHRSIISKKADFSNTSFNDLADFYRTNFNEVNFERTDFEKISVFSEAEFYKKVDFKYTKFLGKSIFRDTVIKGKLDLRNTIFNDEANFLDITSEKRKKINGEFYGEPKRIDVSNRETARIIKNFYDNSNNIIEANRFYALEMNEREKELSKENICNNIMEWIVFKAHSIASNHSQDYILPVLWILNLALFMLMITSTFNHNNVLAYMSALVMSVSSLMINKVSLLKVVLVLNFIIFYFLSYVHLDSIANLINPFSVMTGKEALTFGLLIYKVTIAYLIYQFIVSVRQNTRRK